jgi:hypothetical protein
MTNNKEKIAKTNENSEKTMEPKELQNVIIKEFCF